MSGQPLRLSETTLAEGVRMLSEWDLDLAALQAKNDADVCAVLTGLKGLGRWSADVYLMMALRRCDVWPVGDRALAVASQQAKGLVTCPTPDELGRLGDAWRPWRSVAAHLLWHDYLCRRAPINKSPCPDKTV